MKQCIAALVFFAGFAAWVAAENAVPAKVGYHGIRRDDPGGAVGLRNPERGWRTEAVFAEPDGASFYRLAAHLRGRLPEAYSDATWLLDASHYEPFGLTLAQMYCYLDGFQNGDLSGEKLEAIQRGFDGLRAAGLKAVLRFAYEKSMEEREGPTIEIILKHLDQLAPLIRKNADVIFVLQAGFVGAWGEWHSSARGLEKDHSNLAAIVKKLLEVLPEGRMTQVRVPKYKRWALGGDVPTLDAPEAFGASQAARIGFHNDGFLAGTTCGGTWTEPPLFSNPGNPEFDYMTTESAYVPVDGELFWSDIDGRVDGFQAAERMRLHHYSSFSIAHSYSGMEGKTLGMDVWMTTPMDPARVAEAKLPVSDGYFEDAEGNPVTRTQFEYIRDHLGYRLELREAAWPESVTAGAPLTFSVSLINRGFSTLINPRPVFMALVNAQNRVVWTHPLGADPRKWQPFAPDDPQFVPLLHKVEGRSELPPDLAPGAYLLGLWMPDQAASLREDARYAVRVANRDVPWWTAPGNRYGVNILGAVRVLSRAQP